MALDGRIDPKKASGLNIEFECRVGAFSTLGYDAIGIVDALWRCGHENFNQPPNSSSYCYLGMMGFTIFLAGGQARWMDV